MGSGQGQASPGQTEGKRHSDRATEGRREGGRKCFSRGGKGLVKGNICKPKGSYVNGLVIKASKKEEARLGPGAGG